jgi:hypothetical protein
MIERGVFIMRSYVTLTAQIDDIDTAAADLTAGVGTDFPLGASSVGILLCYSDMDVRKLAAAVSARVSFDTVGCTAIATMDKAGGFHEMAATLTVLTGDDCVFSAAVSEEIRPDNIGARVKAVFDAAASKLSADPGLLIVIPPYFLEIMLDAYPIAFNSIAPGVPIVGGLPSFNADGDENLTVFNGNTFSDRLVMIAVSGNIRPVFSVRNVVGGDVERKRKVTRASDNVVYQVGNESFTDYLRDSGLPVEELVHGNNTVTFVSNPLLLESGAEFSFARTLHEINLEEGSGTAIGLIPEGAMLSICALERSQIEEAAAEGLRTLKDSLVKGRGEGYAYSTVLAVSCIGRHLLMLPNSDAVVNQLLKEFPEGLTLSGFYGYGEIGPQGADRTQNFAHNESLVLCAF